ncbi:MAG: hypothetical protein H7Y17_16195 [Chlorobia bacterium]|nr:hypothetical protein [Fimbriimonadaceae bacterium]
MNRLAMIVLGGILGGFLGVVAFTLYVSVTQPNYTRDAGSPPLLPGIILGGPAGFVIGLVIGAILPIRQK